MTWEPELASKELETLMESKSLHESDRDEIRKFGEFLRIQQSVKPGEAIIVTQAMKDYLTGKDVQEPQPMTAEQLAGEMSEALEAMIVELSAQAIAEFVGEIGTNKAIWTQRALGLNDRFERILRPHFERHAKLVNIAQCLCDVDAADLTGSRTAAFTQLRAALEQENKG